ncbi:hypothetical protein BD410DRAFT_787305, partial [Rickenella mellea]
MTYNKSLGIAGVSGGPAKGIGVALHGIMSAPKDNMRCGLGFVHPHTVADARGRGGNIHPQGTRRQKRV